MPKLTKVKGIKFGTWARYKAQTKDPDILYFITDKGGAIYRGSSLVIPSKVIETVNTTSSSSVGGVDISGQSGTKNYHTFTIETFNTLSGGTQADPVALTFDVYNKAAIDAITAVLKKVLDEHRIVSGSGTQQSPYVMADGKATSSAFGHVKLTDTVDSSTAAASGGTAVTPKGVYDYVSTAIGELTGAMIFKGTVGKATAFSTSSTYALGDFCEYSSKLYKCTTAVTTAGAWNASNWTEVPRDRSELPTPSESAKYKIGWTYRVVAPSKYAGKQCEVGDMVVAIKNASGSSSTVVDGDWTVIQENIVGAVTAQNDLELDSLVVAAGNDKTVKKLPTPANSEGKWLRIVNGKPGWADHPNTDHGIAFGYCSNSSVSGNDVTYVVSLTETFHLVEGAIVSILFENGFEVPAGKFGYLKIGNDSAGVVKDDGDLRSGVISAGETATFMFDGISFALLAVDHNISPVGLSNDYNDLDNKPIHYLIDNGTATDTERVLIDPTYTDDGKHILVVKFSNGVVYSGGTSCSLKIKKDSGSGASSVIATHPLTLGGVNVQGSTIKAGDVATIIFNGSSRFDVVSIARGIDATPTSGSGNYVTSGGVYSFVQSQIDANALWWEELEDETDS